MRSLIAAIFIAAVATPVIADSTTGTVLAFDRKANVIVLTDKTVWSLETLEEVPADLKAGDVIEIDFRSNADNGWDKINAVVIKG
ncbi:hypothetical protein FIU97_07190 [Roseivivax sp. THAF40]|uniref:hypothetical protein n=1 Tax=unclassified Roseivivax TaxID=2639302 RepID=UPI0012695BA8|nr:MULTISPECIES: hypothetical protein [unclassified Roseivivax]QFS82590.1 hypothetical protein FIV09_07090 [Roseivivax sp. THAF197b]QFT46359.1 hypothetical protein FIU97_07190 [Roseivivax sp. THAF40]